MINFGNVPASSVLPIMFTTHAAAGATVAPNSAFEAADVRVYKAGSATQRSSEAGYTMTSPFDSVTGLHCITIDLADNTDASFYAVGSFFTVVLVPDETVDSLAVAAVIATFRIVAAEGTAGTPVADATRWNNLATVELPLVPTTPGRKLDVSAGGEAGVDWANVGSPTTTVGLSGTTVKTATDVETDTQDIQSRLPAALVSGNMASNVQAMANDVITSAALAASAASEINSTLATSAALASLAGVVGTPSDLGSGATVAANLVDIESQTDDIGVAGAGLTAADDAVMARLGAPAGASVSADVAAVKVDTAAILVDTGTTLDTAIADLPTNAELATALGTADDAVLAAIAALNNLSAASVLTQVNSALDTAISELGVAAPTATPTVRTALMLLYMTLRNQVTVTSSAKTVSNNAGTTIASKALSDNGSTYTEAEMA